MPWLFVRVLLPLVRGNFENSDNEPTCDMCCLGTVNDEHQSQQCALMFDIQVVDSKARLSNCEMNFASQIYIGGNARTAAGYWNWGPNGVKRMSKWAAWGLVKAPLGPPSPLEVVKAVTKPLFSVPIKHFGNLLAPFWNNSRLFIAA